MVAGSRASMGFGRSGLLSPIWRTIQCQSPAETEFLLNFRDHREALGLHLSNLVNGTRRVNT
jgi:hypothetical protein